MQYFNKLGNKEKKSVDKNRISWLEDSWPRETGGVPIPGSVPGEVRGGPKQPDLVDGISCGRGIGARWSLRWWSFNTSLCMILWFYEGTSRDN